MRMAMVLVCLAIGALAGFALRPLILPEHPPSDRTAPRPEVVPREEVAPAGGIEPGRPVARRESADEPEEEAPDAGPAPLPRPESHGGAGSPTVDQLRALLTGSSAATYREQQRAAKRLVALAGPGGIRPSFTFELLRGGRGGAANTTVAGWSDRELLEGLGRAARDDGPDAGLYVRLAYHIVWTLRSRDGVRIPEDLVRDLLASPDPNLRDAGVLACGDPSTVRADLLLEVLRSGADEEERVVAISTLAALVAEGLVPAEVAAPSILRAARASSSSLRAAAVLAFPPLGDRAADESLRLLSEPGFQTAAPDGSLRALLFVLLVARRLHDLPERAWSRLLAKAAVTAIDEAAAENPEVYGYAAGLMRGLLVRLGADSGSVAALFKVAADREDFGWIEACALDRGLAWETRLKAVEELGCRPKTEPRALALATRLIRDEADSPDLRVALLLEGSPAVDRDSERAWTALLREVAESDPNEWVRAVARGELRE